MEKNILIITAHPGKDSFTNKIAKYYENGAKENNSKVTIIDLYQTKKKFDFLDFENMKNEQPKKYYQGLISKADELVFVFPLWNMSEPAILKNFFDQVFTSGFAFKYTGKPTPIKLLKGRSSKIFVTCDGSQYLYKLLLDPLMLTWKFGRMNFCGIKLDKFIYLDKMRKKNDEDKEKILEKVKNLAKK